MLSRSFKSGINQLLFHCLIVSLPSHETTVVNRSEAQQHPVSLVHAIPSLSLIVLKYNLFLIVCWVNELKSTASVLIFYIVWEPAGCFCTAWSLLQALCCTCQTHAMSFYAVTVCFCSLFNYFICSQHISPYYILNNFLGLDYISLDRVLINLCFFFFLLLVHSSILQKS